MHDSKLIFVRAATFGQLAERIFDHESSSLPRKARASMAFNISGPASRDRAAKSPLPVTADDSRLHFREQVHRRRD